MEYPFSVLLVEDEPVSRRILERTLLDEGYHVTVAKNGHEALALFAERFHPIVLTDWVMPEMDGLQLCRSIRANSDQGYVYLVLLTARDGKGDIIQGLEAGADDYLTKPFHHAELIARLKTGERILKLERSLKEANERILKLTITDALTGCYNRGYLNEHLPLEIRRSYRYGRPLSILLSDLDNFKRINDTHGHQSGDVVLQQFVSTVSQSLRNRIDWVARYGGEEFLIVVPETDFRGGVAVGERLCRVVNETPIDLGFGRELRITASFGVTGFDPDTDGEIPTAELLIRRADELLYQAKQAGRARLKAAPFRAAE